MRNNIQFIKKSIIHVGAIALLSTGLIACPDNKGRPPGDAQPAIVADVPAPPQANQCLQQYPYQTYEQMPHEQRRAWKRYQNARLRPYRWRRATVVEHDIHGPISKTKKPKRPKHQGEDEIIRHEGEDEIIRHQGEDEIVEHQGEDEIIEHEGEDEFAPHHKGGRFQNPPVGWHEPHTPVHPQQPYPQPYPQQPHPQAAPIPQHGFCGCDPGFVPVCDSNVGMTCVMTQRLQGFDVAWWNTNGQTGFAWAGYINPYYGHARMQTRKSCWSHVAQTCQPGTAHGTAICQPIGGGQIGIWVQKGGIR